MARIKDRDFQKNHRTEWQNFLWERFLERISNQSKNKSQRLINVLFSNYEKTLITKRLAALALLREGRGTKEISELLWLSRATISALKKSFFRKQGIYKSQRSFKKSPSSNVVSLVKTEKKDWIDDFFSKIDLRELIKTPPRAPGIGLKNRRV